MSQDSRHHAGLGLFASRARLLSLLLPLIAFGSVWAAVPSTSAHAASALQTANAAPPCPSLAFSPPSATACIQRATTQAAATLPPNFQDSIVFSGLDHPTAIRFVSDGRVFVAEKSGKIKVFASLTATTPTIFADLSLEVDNYWDRGLLGMSLDPSFPAAPFVYVLYSYDAAIGGTAPVWNDACPTPPGATTDGCLISGRLSRLTADSTGNQMIPGSEQVFINDWCQQFPSHSIGDLRFGPDGALYASGGDGASFNNVDYGQYGNTNAGDQANPCGDPPGGVGTPLTPPTAEGGALRSQSLGRNAGEPVLLDGSIIRVDPATGQALPSNPLYGNPDPNAKRIIASGLRNPFRFTFRPGTNELWLGDVGWNTWEEVNRIQSPTGSPINNFGWPCYEGAAIQSGYQGAGLNICSHLYSTSGSVTSPYYTYNHSNQVVSGETCPTNNGSSITGVAFYNGGGYPTAYNNALFFADHSRNCIWVMYAASNGLPNPNNIADFVMGAANPVDLEIGPGGDLFYVDHDGGTIHRVQFTAACTPPSAVATANPTSGNAPLTVNFDASGSSDPNGRALTYSWDLDGDGTYGDATTVSTSYTYTQNGTYNASVRVTNSCGATSTSTPLTITVGTANTPPTPVIDTPAPSLTWKVGDSISFSGHATDQEDGTLPASALSWNIILHHCTTPTTCHTHLLQTFTGTASGTFSAPDHEYPCWLEVQFTATDSGGMTASTSVRLDPQTVALTFQSVPSGLQLTVGSFTGTTPFTSTVVVNSANGVIAPSPQTLYGSSYQFASWSDGGPQNHTITAPSQATTYTATYTGPVIGDQTVESNTDGNRIGVAEAFQYTAALTGTVKTLTVYLDNGNKSKSVVVGIYSDSGGHPSTLLGQATISGPTRGAWNSTPNTLSVSVTAGKRYWIAILSASGGRVAFRDRTTGGTSETCATTGLSGLPSTWRTGKVGSNAPMSIYGV